MKIVLLPKENKVGVDGDFRPVDLRQISSSIRVIRWDDQLQAGTIEWEPGTKQTIQVRNLAAEDAEIKRRVKANMSLKDMQMIYMNLDVERGEQGLADFTPYQPFIDAWMGAMPPTPAVIEPVPEPVVATPIPLPPLSVLP